MSQHSSPIVIQQNIRWTDMLPFERFLLGLFFPDYDVFDQHEPMELDDKFSLLDDWVGAEIFFNAEDGVSSVISFKLCDLRAAFALQAEIPVVAGRIADALFKKAGDEGAEDDDEVMADVDPDDAFAILQEIVSRSKTLEYVTAQQAFYCSRMLQDAFGGAAVVVTADRIVFMDTQSFIMEELRKISGGADVEQATAPATVGKE